MTGLPGAALEVSAILIAALGLAWVLRRRAASLRHALFLIALVCAAMVPLLDAALPAWAHRQVEVPVMLARPVATVAVSSIRVASTDRSAGRINASNEAAAGATTDELAGMSADGAIADARQQPDEAARWSLRGVVQGIYFAGLALALLTLFTGLARLAWIASRAMPVESATWHRQLAFVARSLGVKHRVHLACSPLVHAPATCGIARSLVLLPLTAETWTEERIRVVLLHELAHVRRHDWAVQLPAHLLRAVYWFNPLVWLACGRLQQEAERACDEMAVAQGVDPATYASQLLELARLVPARGGTWLPATAMARPSTLRRRVASVLDQNTHRHPAGRASLAGVAALLLLVTVLVAACDVGGRTPAPGSGASEAGIPGGTEKERFHPVETLPTRPTAPLMEEPPAVSAAPAAGPRPGLVRPAGIPANPSAGIQRGGLHLPPRAVISDILTLVEAALEDPALAVLDELTYPITGLRHLQRHARDLLDDDGRDAAAQAARYTGIINALQITGALATNIDARPRGRGRVGPEVAALGTTLHAKSVELRDALLPLPGALAPVSTPAHRAAAATLDIVHTALRTPALTNARQQNWLVTELETLERVALFAGAGETPARHGEPGRWHLLLGSLRSTSRQALSISRRAEAPRATRDDAADLAGSLQELALRIENELRQQGQPGFLEDQLAAILVSVAEDVPGLALGTIRRNGEVTIATFGDGGPDPLTVLIEESASEVDAMRREELSILTTPTMGLVREVAGMRLHVWGSDAAEGGYRMLARIGTVVVNVSAPPRMSRHVMPVMEGIARQLRQPGSGAGDPPA